MTLKDRLFNTLGSLGIILFYIAQTIVVILPFVMIGANFIITFLLLIANAIIPFGSIIFWIWGLVCAIQGVQDFWAILYYIAFAVIWLPFFVSSVLAFFKK